MNGSKCGVFGQAEHVEYVAGNAGLQYGLFRNVKNKIVRLNSRARINIVTPKWVDAKLSEGRLDDPKADAEGCSGYGAFEEGCKANGCC
jgi:hypothetical protein